MGIVFSFFIFLLLANSSAAMYMRPHLENVPLSRLIENIEATVNLPNFHSRLALARLYAMAYALKKNQDSLIEASIHKYDVSGNSLSFYNAPKDTAINVYDSWFGYEPKAIPFEVVQALDNKSKRIANDFLEKAIAQYRILIYQYRRDVTAELGLAWCLMEAGKIAEAKLIFKDIIKYSYPFEMEVSSGPPITAEAAGYLLNLLNPIADMIEIQILKIQIAKVESAERMVTPLIIPLFAKSIEFSDLTDATNFVKFDLDGTGTLRKWKWISPKAGWLVYTKGGQITSALQMFGNVSFWAFWNNGYEALGALDDNHDDRISGSELDGLAVWNDINQNGISEAGELRSLAELKIISFSTVYEVRKDGILSSIRGVELSDGSTMPSFDFVSETISD